ncbi:response regulator [Sporosarcina sp. FSL K6-3457]|uniref:response regulator n=1 Tax=Sporosarcina sp. FSL K6-3457 TaxID=2978204 RepID=UPI0030F52F6C
MRETIPVLIVEDDFRIADINRQFVERVEGFTVLAIVKTSEEALTYLRSHSALPKLILLDMYIPDVEGLSLFWTLRQEFNEVDVIMVTAAKEVVTIAETLRGGIFDYIVKPADFSRFEQTLKRYSAQTQMLASRAELDQKEIDRLTGSHWLDAVEKVNVSGGQLPKGIDQITLDKIKEVLQMYSGPGVTALEAGDKVGVSRSTARRYLEYLVSIKEVDAQLKYGDIGRPERKYMPWTK